MYSEDGTDYKRGNKHDVKAGTRCGGALRISLSTQPNINPDQGVGPVDKIEYFAILSAHPED